MILALVLALGLAVPALAAGDGFSDVPDSASYAEAVNWAAERGYVNGYSGGRFGVGDDVTRQQVIAILWRWAGSPDASAGDYADESAITGYAQTAVDWSRANSIMAGREDGRFDPAAPATRVEIVSALYQYMKNGSSGGETPQTPETPDTSTASGRVDNMEQYDVIFLGYPIWWGQAPKIISVFLESYDLDGKTIVPFCTSGSSGIGSSAANLHSLAGGSAAARLSPPWRFG